MYMKTALNYIYTYMLDQMKETHSELTVPADVFRFVTPCSDVVGYHIFIAVRTSSCNLQFVNTVQYI